MRNEMGFFVWQQRRLCRAANAGRNPSQRGDTIPGERTRLPPGRLRHARNRSEGALRSRARRGGLALRELIAGSDVDHRRRAELDIHPSNCCKDELAGLVIECARRLITSRTSGRLAMTRAMATRCCSPPESWDGKWSRRSESPIERKSLLRVIRVDGNFAHQRDIFENGKARDKVVN